MGLAQIKMPQLGESVTEGTVDKWLKHEGDFVKRDEPLVEVVTDKVNAEIPSPFEGKLVKITVTEGETVRVGAVLAQIEVAGGAKDDIAALAQHHQRAVSRTETGQRGQQGFGLARVDGEGVDDGQRVLGRARRQDRSQRQPAHLARKGLFVRARMRAKHHATAAVVRRAFGTLARGAGALLAIRLLGRPGDFTPGTGIVGALPSIGLLRDDGLVDHGLIGPDAEDAIVQVDRPQDAAVQVDDI